MKNFLPDQLWDVRSFLVTALHLWSVRAITKSNNSTVLICVHHICVSLCCLTMKQKSKLRDLSQYYQENDQNQICNISDIQPSVLTPLIVQMYILAQNN